MKYAGIHSNNFELKKKVYYCVRLRIYNYLNSKTKTIEELYEFLPEFLPSDFFKNSILIDENSKQKFNWPDNDYIVLSKEPGQLPFLILKRADVKIKDNFRYSYNYTWEYTLTPESPVGMIIQAQIQTPEWKAVGIVWDKYKRKINFPNNFYNELRNYIVNWSITRQESDKKAHLDLLVQECSATLKRWINERQKEMEANFDGITN